MALGGATRYEIDWAREKLPKTIPNQKLILPFIPQNESIAGGSSVTILPFSGAMNKPFGYVVPTRIRTISCYIFIASNSLSGGSRIYLRRNGVDIFELLFIPAGGTGEWMGGVTEEFYPGERIDIRVETGGVPTESLVLGAVSILAELVE